MKYVETITEVSLHLEAEHSQGNPVFNCLKIRVQDDAAGAYLEIEDMREDAPENAKIGFDWEEWDEVVKIVEKYREGWNWK